MLSKSLFGTVMVVATGISCIIARAKEPANEPALRGRAAVLGVTSPLTPSREAYGNLWKRWSLKEKPRDYEARVRERYGLLPGTGKNGYPLGVQEFPGPLGKGLGQNCLTCHAGRIAGKTILGLGNASLDLQSLVEDLNAVEPIPLGLPVRVGNGRGLIEAMAGTTFLLQFRDADLGLRTVPVDLEIDDQLQQDIPAWWMMKRKRTIHHMGTTDARSQRTNLTFLLAPIYSAKVIREHQPTFSDIREYLLTIPSPRYPFAIDQQRASKGKRLFLKNCARCHGTYGPEGRYPNKIIPLKTIGTDSRLAHFISNLPDATRKHFNKNWLYQEKDEDGNPYHYLSDGYQAPPLDGVWATAPYFHNASVPTVYHVLHSDSRPAVYTRSFQTEREDYDQEKLGWKIQLIQDPPDKHLEKHHRHRIYDTTRPGRGRGGHTFGDRLTHMERMAVIEYLKTL